MTVSTGSCRVLLERFRDLAERFRGAAREGDLETMEDLLGQRRTLDPSFLTPSAKYDT